MIYLKFMQNPEKTVTWVQCIVKGCDFECDYYNSKEAQLHELVHIMIDIEDQLGNIVGSLRKER